MKLRLNPYALILNDKKESVYQFIGTRSGSEVKLAMNSTQLSLLEELKMGEGIEYSVLLEYFHDENIKRLMEINVLTEDIVDTESINSRTYAFYKTYGMEAAINILKNKRVLILGCGGIGTHMAWHMCVMGVGAITLLDYDEIEESNLNRQILFEREDVGKKKNVVLKEKLKGICHDIEIETIQRRIASEKELEEICIARDYDLIIKALDSPTEFPVWLDNVCKKHKIPYVAGITMREHALVGPTFLPGKSEIGWSDLIDASNAAEKDFGTAPSLGMILYHISDELALEAFKILTGNGMLKFVGIISMENVFTNEIRLIGNAEKKQVNQKGSDAPADKLIGLDMLLIAIVSAFCASSLVTCIVSFLLSLFMPFYLYERETDVIKCTFINSIIFALVTLIIRINGVGNVGMDISMMITSIVTCFGIFSMVALGMCMLNAIICSVRKK